MSRAAEVSLAMHRFGQVLAIVAGIALALSGAGGASANPKLLLYPLKVNLHFADESGKVHTLVTTSMVQKVELSGCPDPGPIGAHDFVAYNAPELSGMAYLGATCHGAKFPSRVPRSAGTKPPADARPAMVVLFFKAPDGQFHYSVFGDRKAGEYEMDSCPLVLHKIQAALLRQVADRHVGQTFQGGDCFLRNQNALINWTNR
jgi:hypothetical protein